MNQQCLHNPLQPMFNYPCELSCSISPVRSVVIHTCYDCKWKNLTNIELISHRPRSPQKSGLMSKLGSSLGLYQPINMPLIILAIYSQCDWIPGSHWACSPPPPDLFLTDLLIASGNKPLVGCNVEYVVCKIRVYSAEEARRDWNPLSLGPSSWMKNHHNCNFCGVQKLSAALKLKFMRWLLHVCSI